MKCFVIPITLLFFAIACAACASRGTVVRTRPLPPPTQRVVVDVSVFYDSLSPYGRWFSADDFGWVWTPYDVPVGWRPYTHGHWVFTDYGWTWVSAWRWGWAPFHYGRWVHDRRHGWFWAPGRVWGPAWVVWRRRPGWIGWAAMPPDRGWRIGMEFDVADDPDVTIEPSQYSFVEEREFTSRNLDRVLAVPARNVTLLEDARSITNYVKMENRIVNRSLEVEAIEKAAGQPIPRRRVMDAASASGGEQISGNDVLVYRPNVSRSIPERAPQATAPQRPSRSAEDLLRREERERRQLETEQAREQKRLEEFHRREQSRPVKPPATDEVRRRQETERRAQDEQRQRERDLLRSRQETRRQVEPPAPKAPPRKPAEEKKPMPQRKPPDRPE